MRNSKGHFVRGNSEGFNTNRNKALTAQISIRITAEDKETLKSVPIWQERLRTSIQQLIEEHGVSEACPKDI